MRHTRARFGRLLLTFTTAVATAAALYITPMGSISYPQISSISHSHPDPLASSRAGFLAPSVAEAAPVATNSSNSIYFKETGHNLKDAFLNYWLMYGDVRLYGYPITEEFSNNGVMVQYFERSRFEYNPNSRRPWKVDLASVGSLLSDGRNFPAATQPRSTTDRAYFEQTRHTVGGAFYRFWKAGGGLDIFGYPISEEVQERGATVQYFERARFELTARGRVQLGHVGADLLAKHLASGLDVGVDAQRGHPGFHMSFRGQATIFSADWNRLIKLNKQWGNLPQDFVGSGLYAAAPADLGLYGRWARITRGNRSVSVQFIDVINWPDIPYVRSKGIIIDLGQEAYRALGLASNSRYEVNMEVLWPGEVP